MKKTVDIISVTAFLFIICLVGSWESGYITALDVIGGIAFTIPCVMVCGFICSLIASVYDTHKRQYVKSR